MYKIHKKEGFSFEIVILEIIIDTLRIIIFELIV